MRLLVCTAALALAPVVARAADTWTTPHPGMRRLHRVTASQNINVLVVDLCAPGVRVRATRSGERQRTVSSFAALVGAEAAINGDFFSFATYSTNGPAMSGGAAWGGTDHNYVAPVQFGAGRVALPAHNSTAGVQPWAREVVSGHPTLLVGGVARDNSGDTLCSARHPRTAVGFSANKRSLFLAVVDGRATGRLGMTCAELGTLMRGLGASDALNMDGGGSSTMWIGGPGVVNFPSDGAQRVVANHLAIHATGTGAATSCPLPRFDATAVAREMPPAEMTSGEEAVVYLELTNDGVAAWDPSTRVGTQDPQDRASAFFKAENWVAPHRPTAVDRAAAPGAVGRFTWAMVAPEVEQSTTFVETFQLLQEGVTWFGPTEEWTITVHPRGGPTNEGEGGGDGGEMQAAESGCSTGGGAGWPIAVLALVMRRRRVRTSARPRCSASRASCAAC